MTERELVATLQEEKAGFFCFGGARMALLDIGAGFWELRRQLEGLAGRRLANFVLQQAGANGGASFAANFIGDGHSPGNSHDSAGSAATAAVAEGERHFRDCVAAYQAAGFGQFEVETVNWPIGRALIRGRHAFEAWALQQHGEARAEPSCGYTAGVLVGFVNVIGQRQDVVCIERACQTQGADACIFELLPSSEVGDDGAVALVPDPTLGRSLNLLEILFERLPVGIVIFDRNFIIRRCNPTWAEYASRYGPHAVTSVSPGMSFLELVPGSEHVVRSIFSRVLTGEQVRQESFRLEVAGKVSYWDTAFMPLIEEEQVVGVVQVSSDVTERVQRQLFETLVTSISSSFINLPLAEIDSGIQQALATLGEFTGVDRSYLFRYAADASTMSCIHEWCAPDVEAHQERLQNIPVEDFGWSNQQLMRMKVLHIPRVSELPDVARVERDEFQLQGIRSLLVVPMAYRGDVVGFLGFDAVRDEKTWTERDISLLKVVGEIFVNALQHKQSQEALQAAYQTLERRVEERTRELAALLDVSQQITSTLDMEPLLGLILDQLGTVVDYTGASVMTLEDGQLSVVSYRGPIHPAKALEISFTLDHVSLNRLVIENRSPLLVPDVNADTPLAHTFRAEAGEELHTTFGYLRSWLGVPLLVKDNVVGMLSLDHRQPGFYEPRHAELAMAFANQTAIALENARLYQAEHHQREQAERRHQVAEGLRDILAILNSNRAVNEILDHSISQAVRLTGAHAGMIYRYDPESESLIMEAGSEMPEEFSLLDGVPSYKGGAVEAMLARSHYVVPDINSHLSSLATHAQEDAMPSVMRSWLGLLRHHFSAYLGVPLVIRDEVYGSLGLYYRRSRGFSAEDISLAQSFADQAALAIENARLHEQASQAAAAAERSRLARDLHDAVTQTLFSASLIAEVLPRLWERSPDEGMRRLTELRELTRGALAEMRTLLLELRPTALVETPLADLLRQLCESVTGRARVPVSLDIEGPCELPPEVKVAFYRIAQEALNNVAKHAGATQATVRLHCGLEAVQLRIQDDGRGFDAAMHSPESLGLGIMCERANVIGASIDVQSRVGAGTMVELTWQPPRRQSQRPGFAGEPASS